MSIGIQVSADVQSTVGGVRQVTKALEDLRAEINRVNGDLTKLSAEDRSVWEHLEQNVQQGLQTTVGAATNKRIVQTTGQQRPDLRTILNTPLHVDPTEDARLKRNILTTLGSGGAGNINVQGGSPAYGGAASDIAGVITSGGSVGGAIGWRGGALAGAALGGPAGAIIGAAIGGRAGASAQGAMASGAASVQDRSVHLEDFRNGLGASVAGFRELNEEVAKSVKGLGITRMESQRLMRSFSELANITDPSSITAGTRSGVGISRAFGVDPSVGVQSMGTLQYKTGMNDRQISSILAETIIKSGLVTRAGEVMESMTRTVADTASRIMVAPELGPIADMMTAASMTKLPGMTGAAGMNVLSGAANAISHGGTAGEAGNIFLTSAYKDQYRGTPIAQDPFALDFVMQGGGFASPKMLSEKFGMNLGESEVTGLEAAFNYFEKAFPEGKYPDAQRANMMGRLLFGGNSQQGAAALKTFNNFGGVQASSGQLGDLMNATGIDITGVKAEGLGELLKLANSSDLRAPETKAAAERIVSASQTETTFGGDTRQARADLDEAMDNLGEEISSLTLAITQLKAAVLGAPFAAGGNAAAAFSRPLPAPVGPQFNRLGQ